MEHVIIQMDYVNVILLSLEISVRIKSVQMTVQEMVFAIKQRENVYVMINGMVRTVLKKNVLTIALVMVNVLMEHAYVQIISMEMIVQKKIVQIIVMLMDTAKMENVIVMTVSLESIVNLEHVQVNVILREFVKRKESVYVIKVLREMTVPHLIVQIIVIIMVFVEIIHVIVKISGLELIVPKNHVPLTALVMESASREYAIVKIAF